MKSVPQVRCQRSLNRGLPSMKVPRAASCGQPSLPKRVLAWRPSQVLAVAIALLAGNLALSRAAEPVVAPEGERIAQVGEGAEAVFGFASPGPVFSSSKVAIEGIEINGLQTAVDELRLSRLYFCEKDFTKYPDREVYRVRDVKLWVPMRGFPASKVVAVEGKGSANNLHVRPVQALPDGVYCIHKGDFVHGQQPPIFASVFVVGGISKLSITGKNVKSLDREVQLSLGLANAGIGEFNSGGLTITLQRVNPEKGKPSFVKRWNELLPKVGPKETGKYERKFPTGDWAPGKYYFYGHIQSLGNAGDSDNIEVFRTEYFEVMEPKGSALRADGIGGSSPGPVAEASAVTPVLTEELAIYLGFGGLNGPGRVVQLDWKAGVVGAVETAGGAKSIACWKDEVFVCLRFHSAAVSIDREGGVGTIFNAREYVKGLAADVSDVAVHPKTGDLVFSAFSARESRANKWNAAIVVLPAGARQSPRMIFHNAQATTLPASAPDFPCIRSLAITPDGQMLLNAGVFNGSGEAVYRFPYGQDVVFDKAFVPVEGKIAADPSSDRWAALKSGASSKPEIRLYQGAREVRVLSTALVSRVRSARIAFAPNGALLYACDIVGEADKPSDGKQLHTIELYSVDVDKGSFRKFGEYLHESTTKRYFETGLDALAIGKKLPWHVTDSKLGGTAEGKK